MQTTEKTKFIIHDHDKLEDLIDKAVRAFYKRNNPHLMYHAFGEIEDAKQVAWTRLIEAKKARDVITKDITGQEGWLTVVMQRGLVDYMRTHLGRSGKGLPNYKGNGVLATTYYMDYWTNEEGGIHDLPIPCKQPNPEEEAIKSSLTMQIREFMFTKLQPREKMMMDLHAYGLTQREIAKKMYVTESRVSQVLSIAKQKIKRQVWLNGLQN